MDEILGLGMTRYPPLTGLDQNMADILRRVLQDPGLPERYREPTGWPAPMRSEYGNDGGAASAAGQRESLLGHFRKARRTLDEFRPDDIIPPFCVLAYDEVEARPWQKPGRAPNVWAMEELGRKPDQCDFIETWSFNSNKCFALFQP